MTPVEKITVPLVAAVRVTFLLNAMLPVKLEESAVLPPIVAVPLFPDCTVIGRATVKAPSINIAALFVPAAESPSRTAPALLPNAPSALAGAAASTYSVPSLTVVVPV